MIFNNQPSLAFGSISIEPLNERHRASLAAAASDPLIWAGHPDTDRGEPSVFDGYFDFLKMAGGAVAIRSQGKIIGCSRYYTAPDRPEDIAIGFTFLTRDHWGGETNFAVKSLMLDHVFACFDTVWFHIDPVNTRSQVATQRLGAVFAYDAELALGPKPFLWKCYRLTSIAWDVTQKARLQ